MKMKVFGGRWYEAVDCFNRWAKGKALTKDVIIHTHYFNVKGEDSPEPYLSIIVIHPEDPFWDATQAEPIPRVLKSDAEISRLERDATGTPVEEVPGLAAAQRWKKTVEERQ
jgi:hypothetical protein